ncbi:MAG TPA: hypothetical protein VIC71_10995 [Gammaproteobacteria bacterium]
MALLLAAWPLAAGAPAFAQETALDVTLQVLDDVSAIEGVLMPLEEEPAHPADTETDSTPPPARSPTAEPVDEVVR